MEPGQRRSLLVTLTLVGMTGIAAAGPLLPQGKQVRRNLYRDRESCERDYPPGQCEQPHGFWGGGGGSGGGGWRGPPYYANRLAPEARGDPGPGRLGLASSVETSIRGGFGRIGLALRGGS